MALQSAAEHHQREAEIATLAVAAATRAYAQQDMRRLVAATAVHQRAAAVEALAALARMLAEQALDAPPVAGVNPGAFAGQTPLLHPLDRYLGAAGSEDELGRMVQTLVMDAGRQAAGVGVAVRPAVTGYVRYLNPPSCKDCTILAGRLYRWSTGFERHPGCDCVMQPSTQAAAPELISDPMEAFRRGQVTGLSQADTKAIRDGADMAQVVNVRRRGAGLSVAGRVISRGRRLTPEGIYRLASDRDDAISLLRQHGYIF